MIESPKLGSKSCKEKRASFVKIAWIWVVLVVAVVFVAALPYYYEAMLVVCEEKTCSQFQLTDADVLALEEKGASIDFYAAYTTIVAYLALLGCIAAAAAIFWRQPGMTMTTFVSIDLLLFSTIFLQAQLEPLVSAVVIARPVVSALQATSIAFLMVFYFLFPNGRFYPRWTRYIVGAVVAYVFVLSLASSVTAVLNLVTPFDTLLFATFLVGVLGGTLFQIKRYRKVSSLRERQQTKWVILGLAVIGVVLMAYSLWPSVLPRLRSPGLQNVLFFLVGGTLNVLLLYFLLLCFAIAILRYHLWDIDVIIRRTLVYTVLTALLAALYFGSVVLLQALFGRLAGVEQSTLAVVISTLAIAALFTPLRRRIQDWIDRRFYRKKYNAQQVLAQFAQTARDETDLDALLAELTRVVQETLQPEHVSIWLKKQ
jgi:hypothetical protein